MKSVIVGYGNAARKHEEQYPSGVQIIGVVDIKPEKLELAKQKGYEVFSSIESAVGRIDPDFWDVCVPTDSHYSIAKVLLKELADPKILIEKTVCQPQETSAIISLVENHTSAQVAVNENYISSRVTKKVRELIEKNRVRSPRISIEFSKNRTQDVLAGRFLDAELGVFSYEGSHMITCVSRLGEGYYPKEFLGGSLHPLKLPDGKTRDGKNILQNQGFGELRYRTVNGSVVDFYTSMNGKIKFIIPQLGAPAEIPFEDTETRYRVMKVEEEGSLHIDGVEILARYEPIGRTRNRGKILEVQRNENPSDGWVYYTTSRHMTADNSMHQHLTQVVEYFKGNRDNPSPVAEAVSVVDFLSQATKKAISVPV